MITILTLAGPNIDPNPTLVGGDTEQSEPHCCSLTLTLEFPTQIRNKARHTLISFFDPRCRLLLFVQEAVDNLSSQQGLNFALITATNKTEVTDEGQKKENQG